MNKLTKKIGIDIKTNEDVYNYNNSSQVDVIAKLGKLEDIEEELGIDLITLFKALKNGIWIKEKTSSQFIEPESLRLTAELVYNITGKERLFYGIKICTKRNGFNTACFNYGITWALTKEELEK